MVFSLFQEEQSSIELGTLEWNLSPACFRNVFLTQIRDALIWVPEKSDVFPKNVRRCPHPIKSLVPILRFLQEDIEGYNKSLKSELNA